MPALNQADLSKRLGALPGWTLKGGRIEKRYQLSSFTAALEFVQEAAVADGAQPRLEMVIHGNVVTLSLDTDSQNGVSEKHLELAGKLEKLPRSQSEAAKETNA